MPNRIIDPVRDSRHSVMAVEDNISFAASMPSLPFTYFRVFGFVYEVRAFAFCMFGVCVFHLLLVLQVQELWMLLLGVWLLQELWMLLLGVWLLQELWMLLLLQELWMLLLGVWLLQDSPWCL